MQEIAYTDAAGRAPSSTVNLGAGLIGGLILTPGVYTWSTNVNFANSIYLNGGPCDVFVFQIAQSLVVGSGARVILLGGAQAANIFWQVAEKVDVGTTAHMEGTILCATDVTFKTKSTLNGRILAQTEAALQMATIVIPIHWLPVEALYTSGPTAAPTPAPTLNTSTPTSNTSAPTSAPASALTTEQTATTIPVRVPVTASFERTLENGGATTLAEIPAGVSSLIITLTAADNADLDIQLFDKSDGGTAIVGYGLATSTGLGDNMLYASGEYKNRTYHYSGFNGVGGNPGNEVVRVDGITNTELTIKVDRDTHTFKFDKTTDTNK
jgi:hypothetical protein